MQQRNIILPGQWGPVRSSTGRVVAVGTPSFWF